MANPSWFNAKDYLTNKLAQLQTNEPEGNWNVYSMAQAFANEGYEGEDVPPTPCLMSTPIIATSLTR